MLVNGLNAHMQTSPLLCWISVHRLKPTHSNIIAAVRVFVD
jgi:hypothetical protein